MPRSTYRYPFEEKVLGRAGRLSEQVGGSDRAFLMVLDGDGAVRSLEFGPAVDDFRTAVGREHHAGGAYLFYDPFDAPEWTYLAWRGVDRTTMERWVGAPFEVEDFLSRFDARGAAIDFPSDWSVMF